MNPNISITGLGLLTPLGNSADQTWNALLAGAFIRDHARIPTMTGPDRIGSMAIHAAREAIRHAGWSDAILHDDSTALVIGTSKGPIEKFLLAGESHDFGLAELTTSIAQELHLSFGPRCATSAACASGLHALIQGILLLRSGVARRVLVVAAEASVHPLFIGSFRRLGVLPPEGHGCRPFDRDRRGFLISEAAAAICLEIAESPCCIARIDRFAMYADATHLTGGNPSGRALRHLLRCIVDNRPVDLIHAHATGTEFNDPVELAAIESTIAVSLPQIYSHKGALGHSLGAAGLISVVLNCLSHRTGTIPGNIQTREPLETKRICIAQCPIYRPIQRSLAIAAGFGGAIAGISLMS